LNLDLAAACRRNPHASAARFPRSRRNPISSTTFHPDPSHPLLDAGIRSHPPLTAGDPRSHPPPAAARELRPLLYTGCPSHPLVGLMTLTGEPPAAIARPRPRLLPFDFAGFLGSVCDSSQSYLSSPGVQLFDFHMNTNRRVPEVSEKENKD
ncbi:hypothetical protein EJB05_48246, partial [Eragrostis curvula]